MVNHKMQDINQLSRPGEKTRKGIQHENISAEEQHMLTELVRVYVAADEKRQR